MYTRQCLTNMPGQKMYCCMSARSTQHDMLLHNLTILHTNTFFAPACHPRKKILSETKLSWYSLIHPHFFHMSQSTSKYNSNTNQSWKVSLFPFLVLGFGIELWLWLGLRLCSNHPLAHYRYISLHATTRVANYIYLYILHQYYHTNKDRGGVRQSIFFTGTPF